MRVHGTVLTVLFAPLVGTLVWFSLQLREMLALDVISALSEYFTDPAGMLQFALVGWLFGLALTILVGFPVGFLTAFILRKTNAESGLAYSLLGFSLGYLAGLAFGSLSEFGLPSAVTGAFLGIGYWQYVRKAARQAID